MEQLTQAQHKAAEALYKQQAPAAGGGARAREAPAAPGGAPAARAARPEGDVIDAEVVDDEKK